MSNVILDKAVHELETKLITMATLAEANVTNSVKALLERDEATAAKVEEEDNKLDQLEVEIDQAVFSFLYRERPVAHDLRFAITAGKISSDLERIGDCSVTVARCAVKLSREPEVPITTDITEMGRIAVGMLRDAISCYSTNETTPLEEIIKRDKGLDRLHHQLIDEVTTLLQEGKHSAAAVHYIILARSLERIGDHAKNIAEELVFLIKAVDIRHGLAG